VIDSILPGAPSENRARRRAKGEGGGAHPVGGHGDEAEA